MKSLKNGLLISIEGIDGSGKSTLANKLRDSLQKEDLPVILTYEPGDTQLGKTIRPVLQEKSMPMCDKAEYLLYAADRAQHFQEVIVPNLEQKKLILCDRMGDSSIAYQGYGRGLDVELIRAVNTWAMQNISPDLTFYVQLSVGSAIARLRKRKGRPTSIEQEKEAFTKKVLQGFETTFANNPKVIALDGEQPADMLHKIAHANIMRYLKDKNLIL